MRACHRYHPQLRLLRCSEAVRHTIAQLNGTRSAACALGLLPHESIWTHFESLQQGLFPDFLKLEIDLRSLQVAFVVIRTIKTYIAIHSIQDLAEFFDCVHDCCRACKEVLVILCHSPYDDSNCQIEDAPNGLK